MKTAILLVAYGSTNPGGRAGLDNFERLCRQRFPDYPLRWAYSSAILRSRLADSHQKSDSVCKAIMRLYYENFKAVAVQPLQTIQGREHEGVAGSAMNCASQVGMKCAVGLPLLAGPDSVATVADALLQSVPAERLPEEDVIFMGHGAKHKAASAYQTLHEEMRKKDRNTHIGSMSGPILLEHILPRLSSEKVWLIPLLSVTGRHALHDMGGDQPDSWKSRLQRHGHHCVPVLKGMASSESIANIWLKNLETILINADLNY